MFAATGQEITQSTSTAVTLPLIICTVPFFSSYRS